MRIAFVHSFYSSRSPSGENECVLSQLEALREAGHELLLLARHTDRDQNLPAYAARAAFRVVTGFGPDPTDRLTRFRPDVVHVHNLFPNIGTRWVRRWPGPLVATLQNFRAFCANGYLLRAGAVCTACPDGRPIAALQHACYRGSRTATLPLVVKNARGVEHDPLLAHADRVVAVSERASSVYARYGVSASRLEVIPNYVARVRTAATDPPSSERWLGAGRLSPEKGFRELLAHWPPDVPLDIVGDGPDRDVLERETTSGAVRFLGAVPRGQLRERLGAYTGLAFPSRWYEGSPLIVAEGLEAGLPIVALRGNTASDIVLSHGVGEVYDDRESLDSAIGRVRDAGRRLRQHARRCFEAVFTQEAWTASIVRCYEHAQDRR